MRSLILSIVEEKSRYRSVDAVVYLTNHFVEVSELPYAALLWAPIWKGYPSHAFYAFVNWLGKEWSAFCEEKLGPFEGGGQIEGINWDRAHVVSGIRRTERFEG